MYNVLSLVLLTNTEWLLEDDINKTVDELMAYDEVFINVTHSSGTGEHQIDLTFIPEYEKHRSMLIADLLATFTLPDVTPMVEERSITNIKHIRYDDLFDHGYNASRCSMISGLVHRSYSPDLLIESTSLNVNEPVNHVHDKVYLVNGRASLATVFAGKAYLVKAYDELNVSPKESCLGLLDFTDWRDVVIEEFDMANLSLVSAADNAAWVKYSCNNTLAGHTTLLFQDGYLINDFKYTGGNDLSIHVNYDRALSMVTANANDLIYVDTANMEGSAYNIASFDPVVYLNKTQSFMVHIPTTTLRNLKEPLGRTDIFNLHTHWRVPKGIMIQQDGSIGHYKPYGVDQHDLALSSDSPLRVNRILDTVPDADLTSVTNGELNVTNSPGVCWMLDYYTL